MTTLQRIRAEIEQFKDRIAELPNMADSYCAVDFCLRIIDKCASEECDNDCEHCAYIECPKEPCEDAVSRQAVLDVINKISLGRKNDVMLYMAIEECIEKLPSVQPKAKTWRCKECKYFEHDSVANVDGIPLIVAHEICNKWGDGCKTKEDGYCYLFEPQESEDKE